MKKSMQTNKKIEMGLIERKENIFSKIIRFWNIVLYKEEISFIEKIQKYVIKNKPKGKIIIPQMLTKEKKLKKKN